jgi:DNA-binding transcriptional LysR family regulator
MKEAIDLRRSQVFHAVVLAGGINQAARMLAKSPPAIHHDLKQLQISLGFDLTQRVGRNLQLTSKGREYFLATQRLLDDFARFRDQLTRKVTTQMPLLIGAVSGFGRYRLAPTLFAHAATDRDIELVFATHDELLSRLMQNRLDFMLTYQGVTLATVRSEVVTREQLVLIGASGIGALDGKSLTNAKWVTYDEYQYVFGRWFTDIVGQQPDRIVRGDHVSELEEAMEAVASGRGLCIVPRDAVFASQWRGRLATPETKVANRRRKSCTNNIYLLAVGDRGQSADFEFLRSLMVKS